MFFSFPFCIIYFLLFGGFIFFWFPVLQSLLLSHLKFHSLPAILVLWLSFRPALGCIYFHIPSCAIPYETQMDAITVQQLNWLQTSEAWWCDLRAALVYWRHIHFKLLRKWCSGGDLGVIGGGECQVQHVKYVQLSHCTASHLACCQAS